MEVKQSFALLIAVLALAGGAKAVLYDSLDPDLFWHLRVADQLAAQPFPGPIVDQLSFASIKTPWTPYSWLADLGMRALWDHGGYRAAVAATGLMTAGIVVLLALSALELTVRRYGEPRFLAGALAVFVGEFLCLPYLSFRPVLFALLLLALIVWLLRRDLRLQSGAVWLVVPLTVLLVNIHLYAVFVPSAALGLWIGTRFERRYAILLAATALACLMTPMLPGALAAAWHYQFNDVMVGGHVIAEMQPFYHGALGWVAAALALVVIAAALGNRRALGVGEWIWLALGLAALMRLGRFSPIFAIFAAPTLAVTLPRLGDRVLGRPWIAAMLALIIVIGTVRVARAFPSSDTSLSTWINRLWPDGGYPTDAADFVRANVPAQTHHVICEFTWGGYLEWRLGENWQVLMDGRTQLYSPQFWTAVYLGTPARRKSYLASVSADAAVVPAKGSAFRQDLLELGWKPIWTDSRAQVLVPPAVFTSTPRSGRYTAGRDSASSGIRATADARQ
jgi:hypothetical protein